MYYVNKNKFWCLATVAKDSNYLLIITNSEKHLWLPFTAEKHQVTLGFKSVVIHLPEII